MLSLKVVDISKTDVRCECLDDGLLGSRHHLNVRDKSADLPSARTVLKSFAYQAVAI